MQGQKPKSVIDRETAGARAGLIGLACNLLLFGGKLAAGLLSGSIAIVADAINNLSDAASSVVTLGGFALSRKPADKEHPYGHARMEYMAGMFVSIGMILVGVELLRSSAEKILHATDVSHSALSFAILFAAIVVKLWMMLFYRRVGKRIESTALAVAAKDSRNDVLATLAVLLGAVAQALFGLRLDGALGAAVAIFILISGILSVRETMSPLLGEAPPPALVGAIYKEIMAREGVMGVHDLLVHSYGAGRVFATVHVEMDAAVDPMVSHGIIDNLEREVEARLGVKLVIHYDPLDPPTEETLRLHAQIDGIVRSIDSELSIHDLRTVRTHDHTNVIFDIGVPPEYSGRTEDLKARVAAEVALLPGGYYAVVQIDRNYAAPWRSEAGDG